MSIYSSSDEIVLEFFNSTHFSLRKNLLKIFLTSFSQYTTICFVSLYFIRFSMSICASRSEAVESWKLKVESYFIFHSQFSIFNCKPQACLVEMMGLRLSRELRAQSFAALTIINRHSLPLLLRIPKDLSSFHYLVFFEPFIRFVVEMMGFEPMTPCLQGRCSPSWATPPFVWVSSIFTFFV